MFKNLINWLLEGDVSIEYQTKRDLLEVPTEELVSLRKRMVTEGWGYNFLKRQKEDGHWGKGFYQPKWTSTHYTLLDLKNLCVPKTEGIEKAIKKILKENKAEDGGINPAKTVKNSDACICGMFLNYACYYHIAEDPLKSIIDFLIREQMYDGGFNCRANRSGATHSSVHTTISVLEGLYEYRHNGYTYKILKVAEMISEAVEFLLMHRLYKSDTTGQIIHKQMTKMPYPTRWKYDYLRALDFFQKAEINFDNRMEDALNLLKRKRRKDGTWSLNAKYPGQFHFQMEIPGKASRMNTLRALRVLKKYLPEELNIY